MQRVQAYTIPVGGPHSVTLHHDAHILSLAPGDTPGHYLVYALVSTERRFQTRRFVSLDTNQPAPHGFSATTWYVVGTLRPADAPALHVFWQ